MPVTLDKTPRAFTVLMQEGAVLGVLRTPATEEERDMLWFDAYWGDCLDVREVTAVDRYTAHITALSDHREAAITDYAERIGVHEDTARTIYRDCRTWARVLGAEGRAYWHSVNVATLAPLKDFALTEVMREHGEL
ncbi:hypothetical protein U9R90_27000 [Streptomyces sp. E11-3]|uniref:hypothetical protein n=1 Tax=Streptomyces sp. E11-3 TaxID=3110112 RepID=UPI00397FF63C